MTSARSGQGETDRLRQISMMLARLAKSARQRAGLLVTGLGVASAGIEQGGEEGAMLVRNEGPGGAPRA